LDKLVPHLASDADGEIVATVSAIHRTLRAAEFDFHDLTAALPPVPAIRDNEPHRTLQRETMTYRDVALWCRNAGVGRLSPKEDAFIRQMWLKRKRSSRQLVFRV